VTRTTRTDLGRLRAYRRAHFEQITARAEPFAHGIAVFTPAHPTKWDLNLLVVDDATGVAADELIAEAERLQAPAGLRHRKVLMLHGGDELVDSFAAAGWSVEQIVVMALRGADVRGAAEADVREVDFEAVRGLMETWYGESMSAAEARDLADSDADTAQRIGARYFLTSRGGEPAACCQLLGAGGVGQVEEVYTAAAHRGQGLASAVIRTAVGESRARGDDLVMILADADDWPQKLYERLGFEVADRFRTFTKKPPTSAGPLHNR
jgi:ribosomal protein S18 acetylase RimI-like enzyme